VGRRVATAVWRISPQLVLAADQRLGPPIDSYLNGSQTWLTETAGTTLEWRLHPVAGYRLPDGLSHYDLWEAVIDRLSEGCDPAAIPLGKETRALTTLWDGLECFAAHGDDVEPATLTNAACAELGLDPVATGLVDHTHIADAWERTRGSVSIVDMLFEQLRA
jgi:hypothetical protein